MVLKYPKSVAVFLSASDRVSPVLKAEAFRVGEELARAQMPVVYGGAECGLMGELAKGVLSKKGALIGVIPEIDILTEVMQKELTERVLVRTMAERKDRMIEFAQGFLIFPGGIGTLDEITEVLCMKSLNSPLVQNKPLVFYNHMDFWSPFLESLEIMFQQRMISTPLDDLYQVFDRLEDVIGYLSETLR